MRPHVTPASPEGPPLLLPDEPPDEPDELVDPLPPSPPLSVDEPPHAAARTMPKETATREMFRHMRSLRTRMATKATPEVLLARIYFVVAMAITLSASESGNTR